MRYKPNPITYKSGYIQNVIYRQQFSSKSFRMTGSRCQMFTNRQLQVQGFTYFEQHVFLTGSQVHLVLVVIHTQVDDVRQQFFVSINHLQLLLQRLTDSTEHMIED